MKKVFVLGSTGSIGRSTLQIIRRFKKDFEVVGLVAGSNEEILKKQVKEFNPKFAALAKKDFRLGTREKDFYSFLEISLRETKPDITVCAISGSEGIYPTFLAAKHSKRLAVANKESVVCAWQFIKPVAEEIIPVDSEHSAIFQALKGGKKEEVSKIILTASGGPFRGKSLKELEHVSPEQALRHPNWKMGKKVTVDSATLMNKGLEVIEAVELFEVSPKKVDVLIHPQSIVHSLVEFIDGSFIAHIGKPDMKIPIAYALSFPSRLPLAETMELFGVKLEFEKPDLETFKSLKLAYEAANLGSPYTIVLNSADEVAVRAFLSGRIKFTQIPELIEEVLNAANFKKPSSIKEVLNIVRQASLLAEELLKKFTSA